MKNADQNSDPYNSAIIETAEEVEVPEVSVDVSLQPLLGALEPLQPPLGTLGTLEPFEVLTAPARSDAPPPQSIEPPASIPPLEQPAKASWFARAKRNPALGMVVAPVTLAALLVLPFALRGAAGARAHQGATPTRAAVAAPTTISPAGTTTETKATADEPARTAASANANDDALETRDAASLTVAELLRLHERRAERKRTEAEQLYQKLEAEPQRLHDAAIRTQLLKLAQDPDTSAGALASMSRAPAPTGPDLLFEVWSGRQTPSSVAELARLLLFSQTVRPGASPSLAVALDLRSATTCEDARSTLARVQAEGDVRSIPTLAKLVQRRGCGPSQRLDCYACLRQQTPQLLSAIKAAQRRKVARP